MKKSNVNCRAVSYITWLRRSIFNFFLSRHLEAATLFLSLLSRRFSSSSSVNWWKMFSAFRIVPTNTLCAGTKTDSTYYFTTFCQFFFPREYHDKIGKDDDWLNRAKIDLSLHVFTSYKYIIWKFQHKHLAQEWPLPTLSTLNKLFLPSFLPFSAVHVLNKHLSCCRHRTHERLRFYLTFPPTLFNKLYP